MCWHLKDGFMSVDTLSRPRTLEGAVEPQVDLFPSTLCFRKEQEGESYWGKELGQGGDSCELPHQCWWEVMV